ncbi:response regulator transcription factor [Alkalibacterium sp. MB6]|uniref:response regulator transcription factor n=1 Tax=Alkalibacterium sp. MB6 TaxID=2081965 RepID=UPI00137B6E41|nr:response regulator transcription factor [Alkalibacterium sp. MB6]
MFSILIVEDDQTIAESLKEELSKWNYAVHLIKDFNHVTEEFLEVRPQMVLMDIMLPAFNGYYWCQEIRKVSEVPIIFLTSKTDDMDMIMAIQMGADDYIQKPFRLSVVVAKIQALLRRTYDFNEQDDFLTMNQLILKPMDLTVSYNGETATLTKNECKIMEVLFKGKGEFVSKDRIMKELWEDESFIDGNTLAVNITRLRKKLRDIGKDEAIVTKKGVGYAINKE